MEVFMQTRALKVAWPLVVAGALCIGMAPAAFAQYVPPPQLVAGVDYSLPNYANSPILQKFVDTLPRLTPAGTNNLGNYLPVAVADTSTYAGSDYYELALVEYTQQMHSNLGPTLLRGYVQLETPAVLAALAAAGKSSAGFPLPGGKKAVDKPSYLGPVIVAAKGRATRIKFTNLLPAGAAGNIRIPTDTTVMGAGLGADGQPYSQNRATLHLHGSDNPWISDGTAHQWITPAGETASTTKGASQQNVPDMVVPPAGSATFYWPNGHSGRLMFYHDHAMGITRLNVYGGEAAGYLLTEPAERALNAFAPGGEIPLVIQDKTFVNDGTVPASFPTSVVPAATLTNPAPTPATPTASTLAVDPLWANPAWGQTKGSLWFPHVYMPNQNPNDLSGANPMGRWDYGQWFWPVFPVSGPLPQTSIVPETFTDTPLVNGVAYPSLTVDPKTYRFRVLNAANDRYFNLQMYVADPTITTGPGVGTEVRMIPAVKGNGIAAGALDGTAVPWPAGWTANDSVGMTPNVLDGRQGGVPDPSPSLQGPSFVHIGSEGGVSPSAVVLPNTPIGYEQNKRSVTVLNTLEHTLFLGPAERADVMVDFSQYAGKTLIVYNDSPAPVPAGDPRYDYYTGDPDMTSQGGAPSTIAGFGPNTRTVMQIKVNAVAADPALDVTALNNAVAGAYAATQPPAIVAPDTYARISDTSLLAADGFVHALEPKTIQELFDPLGRMNATLGVELPFTTSTIQTTIPYGFADPATEVIPANGVQLWKITHNGVDTHAIHFHLFDVQLVNRVGWDGAIKPPFPEEEGWKDTVKMNPLEDVVVALRAKMPTVPFKVPNNIRALDPTAALGTTTSFLGVDPNGNPVTVANQLANFGAEYTWHCHLLGHEENDMMRPVMVATTPDAPTGLTAATSGSGTKKVVKLSWVATFATTSYTLQKATDSTFTTGVNTIPLGYVATYTDPIGNTTQPFYYRVSASNTVGSGVVGFPSLTQTSLWSNTAVAQSAAPAAPSKFTVKAVAGTPTDTATLSWTDNSLNEDYFTIQRSTASAFPVGVNTISLQAPANAGTGSTRTLTDTGLVKGTKYYYRIQAVDVLSGNSAWVNASTFPVTAP
jgi:FtsP/CotA-like multicopper oxidase with cupredoxin domain